MELSKIIEEFEKRFNPAIAMQWDNVGLLLGDKNSKINKILVALEVTKKTIDYATENNFDLIMTHHPMIFNAQKKILKSDALGYKIIKAIENNINIYAAHTNLDSSIGGLNEYVIDLLELDFKYINKELSKDQPIRYIELENELSIDEIIEKTKKALNTKFIKLVHDNYYNKDNIKKIAIVTGSGASFIPEVLGKVDLMMTADVKHHEALDAMEAGLSIIDFGHHESESPSIEIISKFLKENTNIEFEKYYEKPAITVR